MTLWPVATLLALVGAKSSKTHPYHQLLYPYPWQGLGSHSTALWPFVRYAYKRTSTKRLVIKRSFITTARVIQAQNEITTEKPMPTPRRSTRGGIPPPRSHRRASLSLSLMNNNHASMTSHLSFRKSNIRLSPTSLLMSRNLSASLITTA